MLALLGKSEDEKDVKDVDWIVDVYVTKFVVDVIGGNTVELVEGIVEE